MKSDFERWITKVNKNSGTDCWEWIGAKYRKGYGHFRRFKKGIWTMEKAHRFSYEHYNNLNSYKDIENLFVCHTCDNPSCVNPNHLFVGSNLDNVNDKVSKGRHSFGRQSNHTWLSLEVANKIREFKNKNPNVSYRDIGKVFGTSTTQVCRILNNQIWKKASKED